MKFFDKQALETFYFNVYCLVYDFFLFGTSKLDLNRNNQKKMKEKFIKIIENIILKKIYLIFLLILNY